jgi:hypothetical protein
MLPDYAIEGFDIADKSYGKELFNPHPKVNNNLKNYGILTGIP